jgi:hypothetical protein
MLWSYPIGSEIYSSPIVAGNVVYVGGGDDKFYALDASSGAVLRSYLLDSADSWSSAAVANSALYVGSDRGTLYAFGTSNSTQLPTPAPTPIPTPFANPNSTVSAVTGSGEIVSLNLRGNITSSQMSNVTLAVNNSKMTALYFSIIGEEGKIGFSNITIPRILVALEATPIIFIDGQQAQNQGYSQDAYNYYVWYTTHFSVHEISIIFTSTQPSPSLINPNGQNQVKTNWFQVAYGIGVALLAVAIITVALKLVTRDRKTTKN